MSASEIRVSRTRRFAAKHRHRGSDCAQSLGAWRDHDSRRPQVPEPLEVRAGVVAYYAFTGGNDTRIYRFT